MLQNAPKPLINCNAIPASCMGELRAAIGYATKVLQSQTAHPVERVAAAGHMLMLAKRWQEAGLVATLANPDTRRFVFIFKKPRKKLARPTLPVFQEFDPDTLPRPIQRLIRGRRRVRAPGTY
jgi:hypothetical protein